MDYFRTLVHQAKDVLYRIAKGIIDPQTLKPRIDNSNIVRAISEFIEDANIDYDDMISLAFYGYIPNEINSCSWFTLNYGYFHVIVSVDKNKHDKLGPEKEKEKMIFFHEWLKTDIMFIKFNPGSYEADGKKIYWSDDRELSLIKVLRSLVKLGFMDNNFKLAVIYLYYDGFDGTAIHEEISY